MGCSITDKDTCTTKKLGSEQEFTCYCKTDYCNNSKLMKSSHFGDEFIGFSIRMVNPKTNIWTIYWADTSSPENYLKQQVPGEFKNRIGKL